LPRDTRAARDLWQPLIKASRGDADVEPGRPSRWAKLAATHNEIAKASPQGAQMRAPFYVAMHNRKGFSCADGGLTLRKLLRHPLVHLDDEIPSSRVRHGSWKRRREMPCGAFFAGEPGESRPIENPVLRRRRDNASIRTAADRFARRDLSAKLADHVDCFDRDESGKAGAPRAAQTRIFDPSAAAEHRI